MKSLPIPIEILEARVGPLPPLVKVNGQDQLAYEFNLANSFKYPLRLKRIEVVDPKEPNKILQSFDTRYLEKHFQRPGLREEGDTLKIGANQFGIAYLRMNFDKGKRPEEFFHRLTLDVLVPNKEPRSLALELARTVVPNESKLVLAPPVRGGPWLYESESHWIDRDLTEGRPSSAQRFALDLVKLNAAGRLYNDQQGPNRNYVSYGEALLAVADGKVIAVEDGIIENNPATGELAVKGSRRTIAGNYIMLDIGSDVVAVYAHLIPGSLAVKRGDKVKRGDVIGLLGNSGNSDLRHLHFHLETRTDLNLAMAGDGIPYQFHEFNQVATYTIDEIDSVYSSGSVNSNAFRDNKRADEFPAKNGVIIFD